MFDSVFAQRLLAWSTIALIYSISVLTLGVGLAYLFDTHLSMGWQAVGHYLIGAGAFSVKVSYIGRLAALDVLQPHPEGWMSQLGLRGPRLTPLALPPPSRAARVVAGQKYA
jgi:hypothetical protein